MSRDWWFGFVTGMMTMVMLEIFWIAMHA